MANIFAPYAQPARSVMDYQGDFDAQDMRREQLGAAKRTNALADLTAQQQRQTMAEQQRSNALIKAAYSQPDVVKALRATGDRAAIELADKQETQALGRGETEAKTAKLKTEDAETKRKSLLQQVAALQSPQDALALIDHGVQAQSLPEPIAAGLRKMIGSDPRWQLNLMLGIGDPSKMIDVLRPHLQQVSSGKMTSFVDTNAYTNPAGPAPITMMTTPGEDLTAKTSVENNKRTVGASLANAAAVRDAAATTARGNVDAAKVKRDQDTEMKLADDYRAQSKEFGQSLSAHKQLSATLGSATTSPAATLAAATKFMKILDPGSVVRESELGMALAASGVIDRAMNYVSTLQSGQKLTSTQAKDFKNISDKMFVAAQQVQQAVDTDYKAKAKTYGLRPEMVVQELGQNAKEISFGDLK
jgi:hypothetical protein